MILGYVLQRSKGQSFVSLLCGLEAKFSEWNLFELASYGKFDFS